MRGKRVSTVAAAVILVAAGAWVAAAQNRNGGGAGSTMATVGRMKITRGEFAERFERSRAAYRERTGESLPPGLEPTIRRTVLEQMIRAQLLMLEAERQGLLVSEAEAEEEIKRSPFFSEGGRFSQRKFDAAKRNDPAAFAAAVADARLRLSGARMEQRVALRHQPEEAKLRATIERDLATATVEVLALPFGAFDGRGAEPTEREVLDAYAARVAGSGAVPLAQVAAEIRDRLRATRRSGGSDAELRDIYADMRDEFRGRAARVRYAYFDTARIEVKAPSEADLDHFYRGHLADYSSFDAARGEIRRKPLDEVRDHVRTRWLAERRALEARATGERLLASWERGRRDRRAESIAEMVRDTPPVGVGQPVDTLRFGALLGDTLEARGARESDGMIEVPGGILVFQIHDARDDFMPPFEAVRARLETLRAERTSAGEVEAARRMFEADPLAFARDSTVHFSRMVVPLPRQIDVPLTRAEVERYHREHIDRYSAPEVISARHILITPTGPEPEADRAARLKAEDLLRRARAGEDFAALAREFSDDLRTRASGGDLGSFGRGTMHPLFEQAVFALRPGDTGDLLRTPDGYHIIRCTGYEPVKSLPLVEMYSTVGFDAATEKAQVIARMRADSLMRLIRTPDDVRRIAADNRFVIYHNSQAVGTPGGDAEMHAYFSRLGRMKPGEIYPLPVTLRGQGFVISWMDSITPPRAPDFEQVKAEVVQEYRRRTGARALDAKRAELDALERSGWSVDSLAALFGGLTRHEGLRAGDGLPDLGGAAQIDSLLFGGERRPALRPGETSGWVALPGGLVRVRLVELKPPPPAEMAARLERDRRKETERSLFYYYEELKRTFPVAIRDAELAAITLPPPGGADSR